MITRIKAPKFKIGRYVLNEYELRNLMADVAEGKVVSGIIVKEGYESAEIQAGGRLSRSLPGLSIAAHATIRLIRANRPK